MNHTKVHVKHEAKKAFCVAIMNAFLVWNPKKLKNLKDKMKVEGLSDNKIRTQQQQYFNHRLYCDCIDGYVLSPQVSY